MPDIWTRVSRVFEPLRPAVAELERFYAERQAPIADQIAEAVRMSQDGIKLVLTGYLQRQPSRSPHRGYGDHV